jgi:hypothetical protein
MSDTTDLSTLTIDIETALTRAKVFKVSDDATRLKASESRKQVKLWEKEIGAKYDGPIEELYRPYKEALAERKEYLDTLKTLDGIFKRAMEAYDAEQDRIRREAAAVEEKKRLEALAEQDRIRRETLAANPEAVIPEPVFTPAPTPEPAPVVAAAGEYSVEVWEYEVIDFALVPNEYKALDASKVGQVVKAMKSLASIPGIKVTSRKDIRQRA